MHSGLYETWIYKVEVSDNCTSINQIYVLSTTIKYMCMIVQYRST